MDRCLSWHPSTCSCIHPLGCLLRDDEITSHPSIRLSVVLGSGIIIRFACPVSLQVLARYLTSQSALDLTSLALSLSVGDQGRTAFGSLGTVLPGGGYT